MLRLSVCASIWGHLVWIGKGAQFPFHEFLYVGFGQVLCAFEGGEGGWGCRVAERVEVC